MSDLEESNIRLSQMEERYRLSFEYATDIICTMDKDFLITSVSPSIKRILGYMPEEITGKSINDLKCLFTEEALVQAKKDIQLTLQGGQIFSAIYQCITDNGTVKHIEVSLSPTLKENTIIGITAVARDIEERKQAEDKIRSLLHEKSTLLKEAHHRIKNNMNTLMGLLLLQLEAQHEPSCISVLKAAMSRLETMRILYDKLYLLEYQNEMSAGDYLTSLIEEIVRMFSNNTVSVQTRIKIDNFILGVQLLPPVGIIVNEIITNIMKYAFTGRKTGLIQVSGVLCNEHAVLSIEDDGIGIPDSVNLHSSTGSGLTLIKMIVQQIKGTIKIEHGDGTKFILEFPFKNN